MTALKPCGTSAAYYRHIRAGERPCDACRKAGNVERRRYRKYGERKWKMRERIVDWLLVDGGWLTAESIASDLGVSEKSVRRYLPGLRDEGVVVSRVVELASGVGGGRRDQRTEWRLK